MLRTSSLLAAALLAAAAAPAHADDFLPQAAAPKAAVASTTPATSAPSRDESRWLRLSFGAEAGGAPILRPPDGPVANTTAHTSATLFARISLPAISSRIIEVGWVPHHGFGVMLESGDLRLGPVKLHLLDLGVFYDAVSPITVSRVTRTWDVAVGAGAELAATRHLSLVADARWFAPIDLWGVVTRYGDTARLIGEELVHGGQLWAGAAYRW